MYVCTTEAMFPEGGDADATATYVSMYQECVKGWQIVFRFIVCMYVSISTFIFSIGGNHMKTVSVATSGGIFFDIAAGPDLYAMECMVLCMCMYVCSCC